MANLTQTPANVAVGSTAEIRRVQVGEAVTQGQPVYQSGSKFYQCDANDGVAKSIATGIVLTPAATDGYAVIVTAGLVNLGATLSRGTPYYVSATKGAICLHSDLIAGDYVTYLGTAETTALLDFRPDATQITRP